MKISVLGIPYEVVYRTREQDSDLEEVDGYCDTSVKCCVVRKHTAQEQREPGKLQDLDAYERKCMRHELTHAFLYESGLSVNGMEPSAWPVCEELVDWIAIQGPKLYAAWQQGKCL